MINKEIIARQVNFFFIFLPTKLQPLPHISGKFH